MEERFLFEKLSDEELIKLIANGSSIAELTFYKRYYEKSVQLGNIFYHEYRKSGIPNDEFISVAFSTVYMCLLHYHKNVNFLSYWNQASRNALMRYLKENSISWRNKDIKQVSLDDPIYDGNMISTRHDVIGNEDNENNIAILNDLLSEFISNPNGPLTKNEAKAARMLLFDEYDPVMIMKETGWSKDKTYYVIRNAKKKLQVFLKQSYL